MEEPFASSPPAPPACSQCVSTTTVPACPPTAISSPPESASQTFAPVSKVSTAALSSSQCRISLQAESKSPSPSRSRSSLVTDARSPRITAVLVDDEPLARSNLTFLLRRDPTIEIAAECGSGVDAPAIIRSTKPDLLFLDVQMPECDGFDVLELLGKYLPPAIIFTTAYDQYALRAFEAVALDYLLKPFDDARFARALKRAKERLAHYLPPPQRAAERLVVRNQGQVLFLNVCDIDW